MCLFVLCYRVVVFYLCVELLGLSKFCVLLSALLLCQFMYFLPVVCYCVLLLCVVCCGF